MCYCAGVCVAVINWVNCDCEMGRAGQVARMGERRGALRILEGKPKGKGPLARPRHRWEGNIKMDPYEVG